MNVFGFETLSHEDIRRWVEARVVVECAVSSLREAGFGEEIDALSEQPHLGTL